MADSPQIATPGEKRFLAVTVSDWIKMLVPLVLGVGITLLVTIGSCVTNASVSVAAHLTGYE
jgi:hypothetical protein